MKPAADPRIRLRTRSLPVLLALLLVLQLLLPYRGWLILLIGLGGVWLLGYLWARSLARGLWLTREMRFGWAQVGDRLAERFTIANESRLPALWVEMVDHSTLPGHQGGRATGVDGWSSTRWRKEAACTRRGLFNLGPTELRSGDPFGLYAVTLHYPASLPLMVLPPVVPLPTIQVAPGGRAGEGRRRANTFERTVSAAGVREYVPGDSLRWVHWPTSARRESLFVRLFENTPASDWWIILDMERSAQAGQAPNSTEEHGVILAASLADRGLRFGQAVGLAAHGERLTWLQPREGQGQRWEILRSLALVSPGEHPLAGLLARMGPAMGQHTSLVIVTPDVGGDWIEALLPLLRRGAVPTVLLLDPASFGGEGNARPAAAQLVDFGISHYIVTSDLLDRPEARPGRGGHWEWRVSGTGRAVPVQHPGQAAWRALS